MKRLINKLKPALQNNRGETLMESVASLLILSILMIAVATMIATSLRITSLSTRKATEEQDSVNGIIMETHSATPDTNLTLTGTVIDVTIEVALSDEDGYVAFAPPEA